MIFSHLGGPTPFATQSPDMKFSRDSEEISDPWCRLLISSTVKFKEDLNLMFQPRHQTNVSYSKFFRSHPGFAGHPTATPRGLSQGNFRVVAAIRWHPSIKVLNKCPKCPNFSISNIWGRLVPVFSRDFGTVPPWIGSGSTK